MTITNETNRVTYVGNGSATNFPFAFRVDSADDLIVSLVTNATNEEAVLSPGDYTINGLGDNAGGSVDYAPAINSDFSLKIERILSLTQDLVIDNQSGFQPQVIEQALDRTVMMLIQMNTRVSDGIGSVWYSGSGAPLSEVGEIDDFYINELNGDVYKKTAATTWTLELTIAGPQGIQGIQGDPGTDGTNGTNGTDGAPGRDGGIKLTFSTTVTDADPGAGAIRFNNATIASVTNLFIDNTDGDSQDITAWLDSFDDSTNSAHRGILYLKVKDVADFLVFNVTGAVTDGTGYRKVPVSYVAGTLPSNGAVLYAIFARTGNKGADGAGSGDVVGPAGATDSRLAAFNTTTGKLIKETTITEDDVTKIVENAQTGTSYTFVLTDARKMVTGNNASAITWTIPLNSSVAFSIGTRIDLLQLGAGQISISPTGGVTLNSSGAKRKLTGQYSGATLWKQGTNTWYLLGDIAT